MFLYRKSTDLSWEEPSSSTTAGGESHPAVVHTVVPTTQDNAEVAAAKEINAAAGLCSMWGTLVKDLLARGEVAPGLANKPLADAEAMLEETVLPEGTRVPAPEPHENAGTTEGALSNL